MALTAKVGLEDCLTRTGTTMDSASFPASYSMNHQDLESAELFRKDIIHDEKEFDHKLSHRKMLIITELMR